ncbi:ATP-binding protein [Paenibacillus senegalensis]|uniref:ATP-binding protein n=1 Tax=Paenibacillus senegalensis TaxID=1465766 RepID=UPI000288DA97
MSAFDTNGFHLSVEHWKCHIQASNTQSILLTDEAGEIICCSPALLRLLDGSSHEFTTRNVSELGIKERAEDLFQRYRETLYEEKLFPKLQFRSLNGSLITSPYSIVKLNEAGSTYFLWQLEDVRPLESLNLLQQFAGSFMRDINLGVILIDTEFRLTDISDMACRVLGLKRAEIMYKPMEEIFASVPVQHQLVQRTILNGMVVRNHAISWMNNQERYELLLDSNLLKDENGTTVGAYVIFKDVSNLRSLEEQVQRSDRLAMIGQIAAGTAHEIRNPLTSIKGFMQVLKNTFIEKGMIKEQDYTDIMLTEINRINELVSEFLLLSKPKNVSYQKVDLKMVMKEILPIINNEALLHGVNVYYESSPGIPQVIADGELLKQVFLNICKNGIEAMVDGGSLSITKKLDQDSRRVIIEIRDTGPGIPNFVIDKIFDPFFTTKENGTGLGLSVCQRIIHDIGGSIRVASKGYGTTFTVAIPYA